MQMRIEHLGRHFHELRRDLVYSARALRRSPAFTLSTILVLALGIGASTAVFGVVDAVLLAKLPYAHDEQLVRIYQQNSPTNRWTLSVVDEEAIERFGRSFSAVGAMQGRQVGVSAGRDVVRLSAGYITAGFLDALAVTPIAGRRLTRSDESPDAPPVAVVGHKFALQSFGADGAALDKTVTIDGIAHRVVGVLGATEARLANRYNDVWPVLRRVTPTRRGPNGLLVIARMRGGVTIDQARRDLDAVSVRIFPDWQASFQDKVARLTPYSLRSDIVGDAGRSLSLVAAAVALVLLIAICNVASLSVVRSMRRWREISLRSILGAPSGRLARLILTESVLLAVTAGVLGIAFGGVGLRLLQRVAVGIPRLDSAHLDARSVGLALSVAIVAGIAIGIMPALRLLGASRSDALRDGTRSIGDSKRTDRIRAAFVTAEFALALPVLAAGALLLASVLHLQRVKPGFDPAGVHTTTIGLPSTVVRNPDAVAAFWSRLMSALTEAPGVSAVGLSSAMLPNDNGNNNNNFDLVDAPVAPGGAQPSVSWATVTAGFFAAVHVPLEEGRLFTMSDTGGNRPVVVVTHAWARHYYPSRSAIGRELISGGCTTCPHTVVVGVVGDVTMDGLGTPGEALFSPLSEGWPAQLNLYVRSSAPAPAIAEQVRDAVRAAGATAGVGPTRAMEDEIYNSVAAPRHLATILIAFATAALFMAAVGIFGLLSYAVALRRREIGVRVALGAAPGRVVRAMVGAGMRFAVIGSAIGLALTAFASRRLRDSLFEVSALDPVMLLAVTGGLLAVALVASWLPARRAARIDPLEAMRPE